MLLFLSLHFVRLAAQWICSRVVLVIGLPFKAQRSMERPLKACEEGMSRLSVMIKSFVESC